MSTPATLVPDQERYPTLSTARVRARPIEPDDAIRLERMFHRLSPTSVYQRFFTPVPQPRRAVLEHLATVDHDRRDALVAVVGDEIIGVARFDRLRADPTTAEVAVTVEDGWHHRGVATFLLRQLARRARRIGVERFVANVLPQNRAAVALAHHLAPGATGHIEDGNLEIVLPLVAA